MGNGRLLSVTPFVFSAAATGTSLVAADFAGVLGGKGPLLLALDAGASLGMFRVPVGSYHLPPDWIRRGGNQPWPGVWFKRSLQKRGPNFSWGVRTIV